MEKLAVRAPQWLGDAVVSSLFLSRLKAARPSSAITVLCMQPLAPMFEGHPAVASVLALPYPAGTVFDAAKTIRVAGFDAIYILPRSFRTALEARLAGVPKRVGYGGDARGLLLTETVPYDPRMIYPLRYLRLIGDAGAGIESRPPYFPSRAPSKDPFAGLPKPLIGVGPASIAPSRTWDAARFAEAASRLQAEWGGTVVLFGTSKEAAVTAKVRALVRGSVIDTAGRFDLPELGWAISQCRLLLANDSGLMHVASCFQIPTAVVFGASDPTYAVPPWGRVAGIQHKEIECVPCLRNECRRMGKHYRECLTTVSPDEVVGAAKRLLENRR